MQVPLKHHFLPVFYLKQWAERPGGMITEFCKPYGNQVKTRRKHPEGTGYIKRLYAAEGPDDLAYEIESDFFSPVDSQAADALWVMLGKGNPSQSQRAAWAKFLVSLMCRMPEDVRLSKDMIAELARSILPSLRPFYEASRSEGDTDRFDELSASFEAASPSRALRHLKRMISHEKLLSGIQAMTWDILPVQGARRLLTSDRPITYTNVLGHADSHLVLPVGPHRLFVAAFDVSFIRRLRSRKADELITLANRAAVEQADKYVFGSDNEQLRFVQNRMGQGKSSQLVERMITLQRERYPAMLEAISRVPLEPHMLGVLDRSIA
ncbi:DUF4238 domain-containing protein [Rhizobium leguminosarum]|nr:DUF4238 domain-containing protein [Rhizobium leguminosarum]MBY5868786.1 DUF4238 domain-containing protein [Rhizobium leguminosarum]